MNPQRLLKPVAAIIALCGYQSLALAGSNNCSLLAGRYGNVTVTTATLVEEPSGWQPQTRGYYQPVPVTQPLCRLQGEIEGNIGFELWLPTPTNWNHRLLAAGVGGDAGIFNFNDMSRRLNQGFATFSTDSGHKSTDARWMANPKAREDYTHRATHLTTLAAKQLVAQYYGIEAQHSYFLGCSGGGRQGLKEMQKYPDDFDGIVSGAPGPYMPLQSVRMMWFALRQKHNPEQQLTDDDWNLYEHAATQQCDSNDGVADGIIENPMRCNVDIDVLQCKKNTNKQCLTPAKISMLKEIVAPMVDENNQPMDFGLMPGVRTRPGPPSPLLRAMWADGVYDDEQWDEDTFQRSADLAAANKIMPELRADNPDINAFIKQGSKAIIYQGWADPSTVAGPTLDYYQSLAKTQGGVEKLSNHVRLFMVPGMYHCRRGPGADSFGGSGQQNWANPTQDILWALIDWVENDRAPEQLIASKLEEQRVTFTRKLCPFPQVARYNGSGNVNDATSYQCEKDNVLSATLP